MTFASRGQAPRSAGLDLVRAIAILLVLLGHCGAFFAWWYGIAFPWQLAVGGFYGVELFFVLSGLLIGRLLIDILDRGPTPRAWLVFMTRRWMRTLPLYFLWLFVLAAFWPPHGPEGSTLWRVLPWFVTMTQNLAWGRVDSWFGVSWSLAVEEWFYLLFPPCCSPPPRGPDGTAHCRSRSGCFWWCRPCCAGGWRRAPTGTTSPRSP
jgi:peptidoglycan/LPS O-acetylase OafA/YrhL